MKLEIARKIAEAAREFGHKAEIRESYSGRGTCGEKTAAVEIKTLNLFAASAALAAYYANDSDEAYEIAKTCLNIRTDGMGRDIIVY